MSDLLSFIIESLMAYIIFDKINKIIFPRTGITDDKALLYNKKNKKDGEMMGLWIGEGEEFKTKDNNKSERIFVYDVTPNNDSGYVERAHIKLDDYENFLDNIINQLNIKKYSNKKLFLIPLFATFTVGLLIWLSQWSGFYTPIGGGNGLIWCTDEYSCLHEIGHHIDSTLGWPSKTLEFRNAIASCSKDWSNIHELGCSPTLSSYVTIFPGVGSSPNDKYFGQTWGGYSELYAELYALHVSDLIIVPEYLIEFYSK
jgi:hypothetical protein